MYRAPGTPSSKLTRSTRKGIAVAEAVSLEDLASTYVTHEGPLL
ncbi:MAG: hypothetical protein SFV23_05030 [Planctomycetaceae bacterium]|nr:hypothetical protein [Planctomycetaceae bacterium]